jgi:hypothetical protein
MLSWSTCEAPLVHELEDGHEYEFVQGAIETTMTEGAYIP